MKKHEVKGYSSNFIIPKRVNVDGIEYTLEDDEIKMLKEKFREIYNEYVKENVETAKRSLGKDLKFLEDN